MGSGATGAGGPTPRRSWPTCSSPWSSTGALGPRQRRCSAWRLTPATPPPASRGARSAASARPARRFWSWANRPRRPGRRRRCLAHPAGGHRSRRRRRDAVRALGLLFGPAALDPIARRAADQETGTAPLGGLRATDRRPLRPSDPGRLGERRLRGTGPRRSRAVAGRAGPQLSIQPRAAVGRCAAMCRCRPREPPSSPSRGAPSTSAGGAGAPSPLAGGLRSGSSPVLYITGLWAFACGQPAPGRTEPLQALSVGRAGTAPPPAPRTSPARAPPRA